LSAAAGFLLASSLKGKFGLGIFVATLAGISLVIAGGCVINNYIDRGIDVKMARTKCRRAMIDRIGPAQTIVYGIVLGLAGFWLLLAYVNVLTAIVGAVGLFFYLVMYGVSKRKSSFGTVIGSVSGAMPIVGGYTAVANRLDTAALILFLSMALWQMPHFYAIAMYRHKDYRAAGLPVMPIKRGSRVAKLQISAYIAAFTLAASLLTVLGYTGYIYLTVMVLLGAIWFRQGLKGFHVADDEQWARRMFLFSLIVLLSFSVMMSVGSILP
jgi:protoheme IX farnesyltransferase